MTKEGKSDSLWAAHLDDAERRARWLEPEGRASALMRSASGEPFVVGRSDTANEFPFVLGSPTVGLNTAEILFWVDDPAEGEEAVVFELDVVNIGRKNAYSFWVFLNETYTVQRLHDYVEDDEAGGVRTLTFDLPRHYLRVGLNSLRIRNKWGEEDALIERACLRARGATTSPVPDAALAKRAEDQRVIDERLSEWFTPGKIGLFYHWGMGTSPGFATPEDFDRAATEGGWSARKWVAEAKRIRAAYFVLASFHTCLGFIRPWKSTVPGPPTTARDYLGELVEAAHAEGIKMIVYMTTGTGGDKAAYLEYARQRHPELSEEQILSTFSIGTHFGGGAFTFDEVEELARTYDIDGFWFDAIHNATWYPAGREFFPDGHPYDEKTHYTRELFDENYFHHRDMIRFVRDLNPRLVTFVNDFAPVLETADVLSHEFGEKELWKVCPPSGPVLSCEEHLLIPSGDWWYDGTCPEFAFQREIKRTVHTLAAGCAACVSEGPFVNGDLPKPLDDCNAFLAAFLDWAGESLLEGVVPGGRGTGGFPAGAWNDGAYGVTTHNPAAGVHYLHVLEAPSGERLSLPDAGYAIGSASLLKTGEALAFEQADGMLTITVPGWKAVDEDGDCIIKLEGSLG